MILRKEYAFQRFQRFHVVKTALVQNMKQIIIFTREHFPCFRQIRIHYRLNSLVGLTQRDYK